MMSIKWVKPVATELLVTRMSRPFAAKPAANWVMKKCSLHGAYEVQIRVSALFLTSSVHCKLAAGFAAKRLLILIMSISVVTGLAHLILI